MSPLAEQLLTRLRAQASPRDAEGQRRFGITTNCEHLGVRMPVMKALAKEHRRNHALALELWASRVYEARLTAVFMDDPKLADRAQLERWVADCDNWALTDGCCIHHFRKTPFALECARAWVQRDEEFVRRAGFTLMATLAVHLKGEPESTFLAFLPAIRQGALDERNFVIKAVNWSLRQIGKRSPVLRAAAIVEARRILDIDTKSARWAARDALRELGS
jgi:3-methyladenine DNA glycosylase AlkD